MTTTVTWLDGYFLQPTPEDAALVKCPRRTNWKFVGLTITDDAADDTLVFAVPGAGGGGSYNLTGANASRVITNEDVIVFDGSAGQSVTFPPLPDDGREVTLIDGGFGWSPTTMPTIQAPDIQPGPIRNAYVEDPRTPGVVPSSRIAHCDQAGDVLRYRYLALQNLWKLV